MKIIACLLLTGVLVNTEDTGSSNTRNYGGAVGQPGLVATPGLGIQGVNTGIGVQGVNPGFGVQGGLNTGFGVQGVNPGIGVQGVNPGFGVQGGLNTGFGVQGVNPGFGVQGGLNTGFGVPGVNPGFGVQGVNPGFGVQGGGFPQVSVLNPLATTGGAYQQLANVPQVYRPPPPQHALSTNAIDIGLAQVLPVKNGAYAGYGGYTHIPFIRAQITELKRSATQQGCTKWSKAKTPYSDLFLCSQALTGQCPIPRPECPNTRSYIGITIPYCLTDFECFTNVAEHQRCCYDTCLEASVCKPAY